MPELTHQTVMHQVTTPSGANGAKSPPHFPDAPAA
jgi:hypothetical protein